MPATTPSIPKPDTTDVSEGWIRGIPHNPSEPAWSVYDTDIAQIVKRFNDNLSGQQGFLPLDPLFVKAMCWTESGAGSPKWSTRPIQIGNPGDSGLEQLLKANAQNKLILPTEFYKGGRQELTAASVRTMPVPNIRAGVGYLLLRASRLLQTYVPADGGKVFSDTVGKGGSLFAMARRDHTTIEELRASNASTLAKRLQPTTQLSFRHMDLQSFLIFKPITTCQAASTYNNANVDEYTKKLDYCLWVLHGGAQAADKSAAGGR